MHVTRVIVSDALVVHEGVRFLFEVPFFSILNVLLVDMNVQVALWAGLLMVEAHGVADLVGDGAELGKERQHGVPRLEIRVYIRATIQTIQPHR